MKKIPSSCVVKDGMVVAVGSKIQCDKYVERMGGTRRKYCGAIGTAVTEKRPPVNPMISLAGACEAVREQQKRNLRKSVVHYSKDGNGNIKEVVPTPKDPLFRTPSEGRVSPVVKVRPVPKAMKHELWNGTAMQNFLRIHEIYADKTDWFITFNTPSRKMTAADQVILLMANTETEYEVRINRDKKYLIIEELEPA